MTLTRRLAVVALLSHLACAGQPEAASEEDLRRTQFGDPLPGLTTAEKARFTAGKATFMEVDEVEKGLGPVFNENSCAACHLGPAIGGGSVRTETRFGRYENGVFDPLAHEGGSLLQDHAIDGETYHYKAEVVPADANVVAHRRTTPLFGLGLVDALPDDAIGGLAELEREIDPSTAGIVARVLDLTTHKLAVGKFGWKDQNPNLFQFSGDAYVNEIGITNPQFPDESCPQGDCASLVTNPDPGLNDDGGDVVAFTDFTMLLAPPTRARAAAGR